MELREKHGWRLRGEVGERKRSPCRGGGGGGGGLCHSQPLFLEISYSFAVDDSGIHSGG